MSQFAVAIAEGPGTVAGELSVEARIALADDGFREAAQLDYSEAVWSADAEVGDDGWPETEMAGVHRIVYRFDADNGAEALRAARAIVGGDFNIRVSTLEA